MPMPVRHLPVLQNWDCHVCGQCCKRYEVEISEDDRQRILNQSWQSRPEFAGVPPVVRLGFIGNKYRLNRRSDGSCVFLDEQGRCRIHSEFGSDAKPLACRIYPFVFVPAGKHWRVGVRYSCPSATSNVGRAVQTQETEITPLLRQIEKREAVDEQKFSLARLARRQFIAWEDLSRIVDVLGAVLGDESQTLEFRWRQTLAIANLCRSASFADVTGDRLSEFLGLVASSVVEEQRQQPPPPTVMGRTQFRLTAAALVRADTGNSRDRSLMHRFSMVRAAWKFARGRGSVPKVNELIGATSFEQLENPAGGLTAESVELLSRYYRTKLESYQFFGPAVHQFGFWDGLDVLALTYPIIMWLARAQRPRRQSEAVDSALQIVDDNFGYNPQLASRRHRWMVRQLSVRGDITRLIAWYAK